MVIERTTYYFEKAGPENTETLLEIVKRRALEEGTEYVVVASTSGSTGVKAAEAFKGTGIKAVVVTHQAGMRGPGVQEVTEENRKKLEELGAKIVTCTHAFGGVCLGVARGPMRPGPRLAGPPSPPVPFPPSMPPVGMIIAWVLSLFCRGMKVGVEITLMAADAGAIPVDHDVIAVAGSHSGADTALLLGPANTTNFLELEVKEIIAKPISKRETD